MRHAAAPMGKSVGSGYFFEIPFTLDFSALVFLVQRTPVISCVEKISFTDVSKPFVNPKSDRTPAQCV